MKDNLPLGSSKDPSLSIARIIIISIVTTRRRRRRSPVCAGNPSAGGVVDDEAAVTEEGDVALVEGRVRIREAICQPISPPQYCSCLEATKGPQASSPQ